MFELLGTIIWIAFIIALVAPAFHLLHALRLLRLSRGLRLEGL